MEVLISMKAEDINTTVFHKSTMMDMPSDQKNGYFIIEIRDMNPETLRLLRLYAEKLQKTFEGSQEYVIEPSNTGFKIKERVDESKPYKKEWKRWANFAEELRTKLENFVYWEKIRPKD